MNSRRDSIIFLGITAIVTFGLQLVVVPFIEVPAISLIQTLPTGTATIVP